MWHYINLFSHKPVKETSDFILNYLKKVVGGAITQNKIKTNTKTSISSAWICPQGPRGFKRCACIQWTCHMRFGDPKLQNIQKGTRKQGFLTCFFLFWQIFKVEDSDNFWIWKSNFGQILVLFTPLHWWLLSTKFKCKPGYRLCDLLKKLSALIGGKSIFQKNPSQICSPVWML